MRCGVAAVCKTAFAGFDSRVRLFHPRRLTEKPDGHGPSIARSNRAGDAVAVAQLAVQRIVVPPVAGSTPVGHLLAVRQNFVCVYVFLPYG